MGRRPKERELIGTQANPLEWTAMQMASAIKNKRISCAELMAAHIAQVDRLNSEFNALVSRANSDDLMLQARDKDKQLAMGSNQGWLHGIPVAVKDLANAEGFVTSNGSPIFKDNVATTDTIHVARMKQAGCVVTAKTNVPEFGLGSQSYNEVFGTTLNAYDGKSTAGGSSGGAATALALNMVSVADGSDFMGSLRNPAAYSNVIGFRPTPGLVPLSSSFIEELPCNGPMAGNVSDTAMLLSTIAGYDKHSPSSLTMDPQQFSNSLQRNFKGSRIGWLGDFDGYLAMEEGVLPLCEKALEGFTAIGCEIEQATVDYSMEELWQTWLVFRHWLNRGKFGELYSNEKLRAQLKPEAVWEAHGAEALTALDVYQASQARSRWYAALLKAFEQYDFLVLPTAQVFPFDANIHWPKSIAGRAMDTYHRWMEVVTPGTLSGCPVINVPAGFSTAGLPMGLQVIGPRYEDFATLQVAFAYEQATRWNLDVVPPVIREGS
ncbi:MAG: amidase [Pseudomonadales bacterium]